MIKPLTLGNKTFPVNLVHAPLAGTSCAAFRLVTWKHGQLAFCCTEMISCKSLIYRPKNAYHRYIEKDPNEGPVCFQLFGNNPAELAEATKIITDHGADLIDLNCGCPVRKVRKQGAGSSLLMDPSKLYQMVRAMKDNTHLPVSIKIRVESNSPCKFNAEIAKVVNDACPDFLVVHGRHWNEHYETPCNYEQIKYFVDTVKVPVIGNGDVACVDSLKRMLATGCAGAMIGRAGVGQPWLTKKLIAAINNEQFSMPSPQEIGNIFIEHIEQLIKLLNSEKFAILQARSHAGYYARGMRNKKDFCAAVNVCDNFDAFKNICAQYFR